MKTFWNEFYIDSLIFIFFPEGWRDTQINITWFPLREINKSGGNKFVAPSKAYQVSKHRKTFWDEFYIDS